VRVEAHDRKRLEQLGRYITRPALSDERVQLKAAGQVELKLKTPWRDGTTHVVMSPMAFMQRLAALVPPSRLHAIRFHGVLAANAKLRALAVPQGLPAQGQAAAEAAAECEIETTAAQPASISWARLPPAGVRHRQAALPQLRRRGAQGRCRRPRAAAVAVTCPDADSHERRLLAGTTQCIAELADNCRWANRRSSRRSAAGLGREPAASVKSRCGAVPVILGIAVAAPFGCGDLRARPWLRSHIPLIEPDMQISRIRLSDKTSRRRQRPVASSCRQTIEPEVPVEVRAWIAHAARGILVQRPSWCGVAEQAPGAWKDVGAVVNAAQAAGPARKGARPETLVGVKG
jgi:Putative transposase